MNTDSNGKSTDQVSTLEEFTGMNSAVLDAGETDVAVLNLFAARGLPGTDDLDVSGLLDTLDEWAERVKFEIRRHIYRFDLEAFKPPTEYSYGNSLGRFFCWYLLQVLQEDCGVVYHPDRKFNPDFCRPEDLFIHGIVGECGKGGTCASMPVVYVAVGRRLGLPVYLVQTRGHLFFRWDGTKGTTIQWKNPDLSLWIPPDRFNVEGSGEGIAYYPDSHYIKWPELWKEVDFRHGRYLRSMTTKEELAEFLIQRSECFYELGNREECLKAIHYARELDPDDERYKWLHAKRTKELQRREDSLTDLFEHQRSRREKRQRLPHTFGHSPNCLCIHCEQTRDAAETLPVAPHWGSCSCRECTDIRELNQQPKGQPGHPVKCRCSGCLHLRTVAKNQKQLPVTPELQHPQGLPAHQSGRLPENHGNHLPVISKGV